MEIGLRGIPQVAMYSGLQYFLVVQTLRTATDDVTVLETIIDGYCAYDARKRRQGHETNQNPVL